MRDRICIITRSIALSSFVYHLHRIQLAATVRSIFIVERLDILVSFYEYIQAIISYLYRLGKRIIADYS
jgi:hypothetical protein